MARTKQALRNITGRSGTPRTSSRASAVQPPRTRPKMLRSAWKVPDCDGRRVLCDFCRITYSTDHLDSVMTLHQPQSLRTSPLPASPTLQRLLAGSVAALV